MTAPHAFTILYRKEDVSQEVDARKVDIDYYYDQYRGVVDLLRVESITQGYSNLDSITVLYMYSGVTITILAPIEEIDGLIDAARKKQRMDQLLVFRQ